jgi:hypothetical protein
MVRTGRQNRDVGSGSATRRKFPAKIVEEGCEGIGNIADEREPAKGL